MNNLCSGGFNQTDGPPRVVKLHIVEQYIVARLQDRDEHVFDIKIKDLGVDRAFNRHRRANPAQPHRGDSRNVLPAIERLDRFCAEAFRGARPSARHRDMTGEFVNEDKPLYRESFLDLVEGGALDRVGFGGALGLFLIVRSIACRARQIVLWLTSTPALFFICWHSSSSVASDASATRSIKVSRSVSVSFA